ncbi:MAG TPA: CotH kinase family protein, partial [Chitinophagaceae bacterium]|nr:CotH kinase family protein [Chitinophagaceae bacterium]
VMGLYAIVEEVDDEFCDHWFNNHDGNLFKGDPHGDLRWKGASTQSLYESSYELKNNSTANNWTDLISLIDIINNTPVNTLHTALDSKLNTARFVKHWAAMDLFSSLDSYIGSGHNYYIYHDTISDRFEWIAWDNNESFGSFKNSLSEAQLLNLDMYYLSQPTNRPLCNQMLTNPVYHAMYNDAFCALQQEWNNAILGPSMDSLHAKIQSSVYADTKKFYSNGAFDSSLNYTINSSGPGGIAVFGLKSFITSRNAAIPSILTTHGVSCFPLGLASDPVTSELQIYPNPFQDEIRVHAASNIHSLTLFNSTGQVIWQKEIVSGHDASIPTQTLPSGFYWVQVDEQRPHSLIK